MDLILFPGFDDVGQFIPLHKRVSDVAMFRGKLILFYLQSLFGLFESI